MYVRPFVSSISRDLTCVYGFTRPKSYYMRTTSLSAFYRGCPFVPGVCPARLQCDQRRRYGSI